MARRTPKHTRPLSNSVISRAIELSNRYWMDPLRWHGGFSWGEDLHLTPELIARIASWYESVQMSFDEKNAIVYGESLTPEGAEEGAKIAQQIADEMGPGVTVLFEGRDIVSFSPPTNSRARQALEDYISEWHPGLNDDVRGMWWAADWPPPPPPHWEL